MSSDSSTPTITGPTMVQTVIEFEQKDDASVIGECTKKCGTCGYSVPRVHQMCKCAAMCDDCARKAVESANVNNAKNKCAKCGAAFAKITQTVVVNDYHPLLLFILAVVAFAAAFMMIAVDFRVSRAHAAYGWLVIMGHIGLTLFGMFFVCVPYIWVIAGLEFNSALYILQEIAAIHTMFAVVALASQLIGSSIAGVITHSLRPSFITFGFGLLCIIGVIVAGVIVGGIGYNLWKCLYKMVRVEREVERYPFEIDESATNGV